MPNVTSGPDLAVLFDRQAQWRAWKDFAEHVLEGEAYWDNGRGARWVVRMPGTYVFYAEIIAGTSGSLVVHGDIDVVRFAHYGDHANAWSRLRWMGHCTDLGYYVAQKASIGHACESEEYDERIAEATLREWMVDEENGPERRAIYEEALHHTEHRQELLEFLWGEGEYDLPESLGMRTSVRVIYAHAALNRCVSLLWEKYGYQGPPETRGKHPHAP